VADEALMTSGVEPVGRGRIASDLRALGVRPGAVLMVHARISALGWMVGGTGAVVLALLDTLGPNGTLMAYAGWEDDPYGMERWPEPWRSAYVADLPPFDPLTAEAVRANGRLPERIRTWPGAVRSRQPEAGIVALGRCAKWIVADHPMDDTYGAGSPLAKLVDADGQVLMLGAPLSTLTLLHHAEATVRVADKRRVVYHMPVQVDGGRSGANSGTSTRPRARSHMSWWLMRSRRLRESGPTRTRSRQLPGKPWPRESGPRAKSALPAVSYFRPGRSIGLPRRGWMHDSAMATVPAARH
jgi:aminoglycoside 3-N-acetyltransferase